MRNLHRYAFLAAACVMFSCPVAAAASVTWVIDSSQSWVRLNLPDSSSNLDLDGGPVNTRIRNINSTTTWTDAGGRQAPITGTIAASLNNDPVNPSITFLPGQSSISAVDDKLLPPNPADWDPVTGTYTGTSPGTSTAPAAYGGRILGVPVLVPIILELYRFSLSNVEFGISGSELPLVGPAGEFTDTQFGIPSATLAAWGASPLGVYFADLLQTLTITPGTNTAASTITFADSETTMVYNISVPITFTFDTGNGVAELHGTAEGQIVAVLVPEPASLGLLAIGAAALLIRVTRRRK